MEETRASTPYNDQELRCIYSWLLFRKPFPNSFPKEEVLYEEIINTLRDRGYTRTWDGIRQMLERKFGAATTRESLEAAIAEVYVRQQINWRNVHVDSDAVCENGANFARCLCAHALIVGCLSYSDRSR
jgi:hypothetical protein